MLAFAPTIMTTTAHAANCTISATGVAFGIYQPIAATTADSTGTISVTCNGSVTYIIALNSGLHAGGSFSNRRMKGGSSFLGYQLYQDAARTAVWGDGTGGSA